MIEAEIDRFKVFPSPTLRPVPSIKGYWFVLEEERFIAELAGVEVTLESDAGDVNKFVIPWACFSKYVEDLVALVNFLL